MGSNIWTLDQQERFGSDKAFEGACDIALQGVKQFVPKYDAILVDEAQDFAPNFFFFVTNTSRIRSA